jgi:adenosylhomocysteine nucleosidase
VKSGGLVPVTPTGMAGKRVLFVMAAEAEYGTHLKQRFEPLISGVGPVESGLRVGAELAAAAASGNLPDLVVSLGSAGSRVLEQAEIYQVASVSYRDMDASVLGFEKGVTPSPGTVPGEGLPAVFALPFRIPGIPEATLSTGANIVSGPAYDGIDADMVDMETFAVLRACQLFDVPLIGLRGVSDGATALHHIDDWKEYLHVIDEKLAAAVDRLKDALATGQLSL